ncbi:cohesin subunit SA-1-like [Bolinopsis microptera]
MLMQVILSWALYRTNPSEPSKAELKKLRKSVVQLIQQCDELIQFGVAGVQKEAFITVCDMLIIFAPQLKQNPNYSSLIVVPDKSVQIRLRDYVMTTVFAEEEPPQFQDDEDEEAKTEVLIEKRRVLASFGKLIAFNIIEMRLAAPIFAQYVKSYQDYGDIVKQMMSKARELNRTKCMRTQLLSLEQLFEELRDQNEGRIDRSSEEWTKIKDLAHRFALMAGVDNYKSRQAVVTFHREGIIYCLLRNGPPDGSPPSNIVFFDILAETTFKLMDIDKKGPKGLLAFLEEQLMKEGEIPEDEIEWGPLRTYRTALVGSMSEPYMYYGTGKRKMMGSPMRVMEVKRPREDYVIDNWQSASGSGNYVQ